MSELSSGTVTFLFTDVEGSTRLWEEYPDAMKEALARHDEILRDAIASHHGYVVKGRGDGVHAAFATADAALRAAMDAQIAMEGEEWSVSEPLCVRMGLHSGSAEERDGDYFGSSVNRVARLMGVGHGGQILVSHATEQLVRDALPVDTGLVDVGEHRLRDLAEPMRVFQVAHPASVTRATRGPLMLGRGGTPRRTPRIGRGTARTPGAGWVRQRCARIGWR